MTVLLEYANLFIKSVFIPLSKYFAHSSLAVWIIDVLYCNMVMHTSMLMYQLQSCCSVKVFLLSIERLQ